MVRCMTTGSSSSSFGSVLLVAMALTVCGWMKELEWFNEET